MAKKVKVKLKLEIPAGQATPAPPVGPALGQHGVAIMDFCNAFNEATRGKGDVIIPTEITIYEDRTFEFVTKTPPVAFLIRKELGLEKGSGTPNKDKVGKLSAEQIQRIAETKLPDLNAKNVEQAVKIVAGTARSMGVEVEGQ